MIERIKTYSRKGRTAISYQLLADLLGIDPSKLISIRNDSETGTLNIIHKDEDYGGIYSVGEGEIVPLYLNKEEEKNLNIVFKELIELRNNK